MLLCPVCSQENAENARFCSACGAALTSEPPREERKVVSVLFADLVGFTSRAEQLDPEDVRAVLAPYWERLRSELEQRGGTVEKFIGDAVMALFGAPVAHDDDPLRAVGAALAIRDWAREEDDLQVRIAVNTGEALVLLGARPAEGEGMAAGDVVNTTARLQAAAPVNGVLVGETTYRATRDIVEYIEHEPVVGKGKSEPIPVWEAVQLRSRLGVDVERPVLPLVGRTRELGVIVDAFERAKSEREPQLVTLVGVPGIGKSRLVGAFFSHLEGAPDLVWWRQGRALPYGDGVSFWAVAEMVKAQAGIAENDGRDEAQEKLRASVERLVDEDERDWVLEHLRPLMGGEHRGGSGESGPAWRRYFEGMAEQRPLVIVFEDMHWADDGLLDFIDHLVDWATGVPILALATARPELLDRRQAWGGGKLNASTVALSPLSDEEAAQIIHGVLDQAALPAETQHALLERAGGNPLYAEQFARLYMERGSAEDLPLPETVQGLIAARLDGLSGDEKGLIQDAAVFGKVFWAGALGRDERSLHSLERNGMLRRERRSAVVGETQYAFRHVLVRDVAYGQIPRAARGEKHVRAADWIESLGRAEDHAELVAHHLAAAFAFGMDVSDRAREALWRAAQRAQSLRAYDATLRYCDQALALWPEGAEDRPFVLATRAQARFRSQGDAAELAPAIDALEQVGAVEAAAELAAFAANAAWRGGRQADADAMVARGEALVSDRETSPARAALLAEKARLLALRQDLQGNAVATAALEAAEALGLGELKANALNTLATLGMYEGRFDETEAMYERAIDAAPPGSSEIARAATNHSIDAFATGDMRRLVTSVERALEAAARAGERPMVIWAEYCQVWFVYYLFGRWDEAMTRISALVTEFEHKHGHYLESRFRALRAMIEAARSDPAGASLDVERAASMIEDSTDPQFQVPLALELATALLHLDRPGEAAKFVDLAAGAFPRSGGLPLTADMATAIASCGRADFLSIWEEPSVLATPRGIATKLLFSGQVIEAADAYARIDPEEEAAARLFAAQRLATDGRRDEAEAQLQRGLAFFRAVGATKIVRDAERLLSAASSS